MKTVRSASDFVYERIALSLESLIQSGTLRVGDRLPSIRQICKREHVSPASALQAFSLLESRGLVLAKPKSGFYVRARRHDQAPLPETPRCELEPTSVGVSDAVAQVFREAGDRRMIPLGAALPSPDLLPTEKLARSLAFAARSQHRQIGRYDVTSGQEPLLRQICLRLAAAGCPIPLGEFTITNGTMEALNLAVRAVARPGEIIAVESPCYFGVLEILESLGMRALPIPGTCENGISLQALEQALEDHPVKAVLLVSSFSNPTGASISEERRRKLVALLEDYCIPLIEDDVYGDLHFGPERPRPAKAFDSQGLVLYCGSFSKSLSPGFRVGWIAAGKYAERVRRLKYISSVSTSSVLQLGLAHFLESGALERHLRRLRQALQTQLSQTSEAILEHFPEGTALSRPQGAMFLWVQLPAAVDALELHRLAAADMISIAPGPIFCPHGSYRNFIRISCGIPWSDSLALAIGKLGQHVHQLAAARLRAT